MRLFDCFNLVSLLLSELLKLIFIFFELLLSTSLFLGKLGAEFVDFFPLLLVQVALLILHYVCV